MIAASHPLDFDWRFDSSTIDRLSLELRGRMPLLLGAPSVARRLEALGEPVLLVDRQPLQEVRNHIVADIHEFPALPTRHEIALADPPWYPDDVLIWAECAGRAVGVAGEVLLSAWPSGARPGSEKEFDDVIQRLSSWAFVEIESWSPTYDEPEFEEAVPPSNSPLAHSPRVGRLLRLRVKRVPAERSQLGSRSLWCRFSVDDYQLAVKSGRSKSNAPMISRHPRANDWIWPYVSRRAPGRDNIDIWSSSGEVAQVGDPRALLEVLRRAFAAQNAASFEAALAPVPQLLEWVIPRPPYRSLVEWQHR